MGCFPSPAKVHELINVQIYNHNPTELALKVFDMNCREVYTLSTRDTTMPGGLHTFQIPSDLLSTGTYFVHLVTYVGTAEDIIDNARFVIVH